jgi:16S rRNA (guanine(966)-N(2))-methyltransferase RsmD
VRIISGSARGRHLAVFSGREIRPTPDRVREAIFSSLFSRLGPLEGKKVLDLFAGTGAMALEALSRGAGRAVLVDQGTQAARVIPANIRTCGLGDRAVFRHADTLRELPRLAAEGPFDLIFLDPPYGRGLVPQVVAVVAELGLLAPAGLVCAEAARQDEVPEEIGGLRRIDRRLYGSTAVHFFSYPETEAGS